LSIRSHLGLTTARVYAKAARVTLVLLVVADGAWLLGAGVLKGTGGPAVSRVLLLYPLVYKKVAI